MFEIFTTREIVTGIYLLAFILGIAANKKVRKSAYKVVKVACSHQLVIPFVMLTIYAAIVVYGLTFFPFWQWIYLKDVVIWVLFVGVPICFNATDRRIEEHYFKNTVMKNFKFAVLVDFFINTFTFNFIVELLLQGLLIFLTLLQAVADTEEKYSNVKKMLDGLLAIIGIFLVYKTIKKAIEIYPLYDIEGWIISLMIPLLFSLLYVPAAHLMAVYSRYQLLFIRMSFKEAENRKIKISHRFRTIFRCGLSIRNISLFEAICVRRMYRMMAEEEFDSLIEEYTNRKKVVNHA